MILIDGASTQSRGRRPLPEGATRAVTMKTRGVDELVLYPNLNEFNELISWVIGQAGLLWGMSPDVGELFGLTLRDLCQTSGSYGHTLEYDFADILGEIFAPYLRGDKIGVRYAQNGGDGTAAAARLARAVSRKSLIATQGYHGAALDFAHSPQSAGQELALDAHLQFDFLDVARMEVVARQAACLMLEVPSHDCEEDIAQFLRLARAVCDENHIPLIIDDVVGGFRFALAGTCERYGVQADLICLGKTLSALGGVSALIGDLDVMRRLGLDVFYSTTFGGSPGPLRVALESVEWLRLHEREVYGPEGHLQKIGTLLKDGLRGVGVPVVGQPERSALNFPTDAEWIDFCRRMIGRGIMIHRPNFVTLAHTEQHVAQTIGTAQQVMEEISCQLSVVSKGTT